MPRTLCKTDGHLLKRLNRTTIGFSTSLWFVASKGNSCPHISRNTSVHRGEDSPGTDSMCRGGPGSHEPGLGLRLHSQPEPERSFPLSPLCHPIKLRGTERFSASLISDLILYYFFPSTLLWVNLSFSLLLHWRFISLICSLFLNINFYPSFDT